MSDLSFDERMLICLYDTGSRQGCINAIAEMCGYLEYDEVELRELAEAAMVKLREMSDGEYEAIILVE